MLPVLCQIARWSKGSSSLVYLAATGNMPPVLMEALLCRMYVRTYAQMQDTYVRTYVIPSLN